ncbi:MAG: CPXCG motif-containing cysteine-rich protein [Phycisphaerales bacterium]|nr:CPXCG motif-containing cysteine-rich protein [Phycisphaerales bacterium]
MFDEATYICDSCGEEIVVDVDPSAGSRQEYVEDCPVCCNPNVITIQFDSEGNATCDSRAEQDRD